tara:strand:+ start:333 stop:719 length:387 start_codon:yes stop_codon:yes gene_type:complete
MPLYVYKHPEKEEYIEVLQGMNDEHVYSSDGVEWERQFTSPEISSQKIVNPWDSNAFVNQTGDSKGTIGDLMDRSAELSEMRAKENGGVDPIKDKKFKEYSKIRGGLKDPLDPSSKKTIENKHVKVKF